MIKLVKIIMFLFFINCANLFAQTWYSEFSGQLRRQYAAPIDYDQLFTNVTALENYITNSSRAFAGQIVAVTSNNFTEAYIIYSEDGILKKRLLTGLTDNWDDSSITGDNNSLAIFDTEGSPNYMNISDLVTYPEYMEITIPLNPGGHPGIWTDFEIKIFNVANSNEGFTEDNLVYYHQTWTNEYLSIYGDSDVRVYYIDDYLVWTPESMYMRWLLAINNISIQEQLLNENSNIESMIVSPSKEGCVIPWGNWQWYTNRHNLRASYVRFDATGAEMNHDGSQQRWNPVAINWVPKRMNEGE